VIGWQGVLIANHENFNCMAWGSLSAAQGYIGCHAHTSTCTKVSTYRAHRMTARAGVLKMKRTKCTDTICDVYKSGICLNIPEGAIPGFVARGVTGQKVLDSGCATGHFTDGGVMSAATYPSNDWSKYDVDTCALLCDAKPGCTHFAVSDSGQCQFLLSSCSQADTTETTWKVYEKMPRQAAADASTPVGCEPFCNNTVHHAKALLEVGWFPSVIYHCDNFISPGVCSPGDEQVVYGAGTIEERQVFGMAASALMRAQNNDVTSYLCGDEKGKWYDAYTDEQKGINDITAF